MAKKTKTNKTRRVTLSARNADRQVLYEAAVQCPEAEIGFLERRFLKLRGRRPMSLREDFCASAASACEWVKRRRTNTALGLDLDPDILKWAAEHNLAKLDQDQRSRIELRERNVLDPGPNSGGFDIVASMNFSYNAFKTRETMLKYFKLVRASLKPDGIYFLDGFGGWESMKVQQERRRIKGGFTYVWDQASFDPITHDMTCHIHFEFRDGSKLKKAFTYEWRLWTLPELQELLREAGFKNVTVYWEGDDKKGSGNGVFTPKAHGEDGPSFIVYLTAER
ncbi:MAG: class I SAM-dependent methyltransferase [Phycisphaerales bacterium]